MAAQPDRGLRNEDADNNSNVAATAVSPRDHSPPTKSSKSPNHRLKLVMPTATTNIVTKESSGSPVRPSVSPVTPTSSQEDLPFTATTPTHTQITAQPHSHPQHQPQHATTHLDQQPPSPSRFLDSEPPAPPVSLEENSDAIALRAAISILQMQRQQSLRDIRDLDKLKNVALEEPERFVKDLRAGKMEQGMRGNVEVDFGFDVDGDSEGEGEETGGETKMEVDDDEDGTTNGDATTSALKFAKFPPAQNVVRAPPIEWAKYHIMGDPLDQMHDRQRRFPGNGEEVDNGDNVRSIAAPYRPFEDTSEGR